MHKKDFFPSYCFHISRFQIIFPLPRHWTRDRDIGPATATLHPRPRHWTRDRDFGLATRDIGPATRDPRLLVKLLLKYKGDGIQHYEQNLNIRTMLQQQTRPRALQQNIAIF